MIYTFKYLFLELIILLYVLLFVYAAFSKFLDFENFQVQLGQSPMLRSYVPLISYGIPITELLLSALLIYPRTIKIGLYGAFILMTLFSTYLLILLTFSDYIPCSCGGILENMGWTAHLIFNLVFVFLAMLGIRIYGIEKYLPFRKQGVQLFTYFTISVCFIVTLYLFTNTSNIAREKFIRHYPHHPITQIKQIDLAHNSYYIAGFHKKTVYLGNVTAPLHASVIDTETYTQENAVIHIPNTDLLFRSLRLLVAAPYFYFYDGTTPVVFRGNINTWEAKRWLYKKAYFTHMVAVDSNAIAIKALSSTTHENILGFVSASDSVKVTLNSNILEKQQDGVFDTDGMLLYHASINKLVYTYYYRNQFLFIEPTLNSFEKQKTIDQTTKSALKIATLSKKNVTVLAERPKTVNKNSATYDDYIFIHSGIMGNFEPKDTWETSSIIDVYSISKSTYLFSFYLPHQNKQPMSSFSIEDGNLVAISGQYLTIYELKKTFFEKKI